MSETVRSMNKSQSTSGKRSKTTPREYTEALLFALIAALILRTFVVQAFRIPTGSMKDTLLIGDFLLVNKFVYGVRTPDKIPFLDIEIPSYRLPAFKIPKPGEIIVFKYPKDMELDYIKRCIAKGGQTIEVRNSQVYVDGEPEGKQTFLKKEYDGGEGHYMNYYEIETSRGQVYTIRHHSDHNEERENFGPVKVPEGQYFMMGDNRDNSADSRTWGFLPAENVVGEAMVIYWSWNTAASFQEVLSKVRWTRIGDLLK